MFRVLPPSTEKLANVGSIVQLKAYLVQLANTWGNGEDKKSFKGRQEFAKDNLDLVLESAREPYKCA